MISLFVPLLYWTTNRIGGSQDLRRLPTGKETPMAKPHPSMALLLDLDERLVDNDLHLEIDRCYSY